MVDQGPQTDSRLTLMRCMRLLSVGCCQRKLSRRRLLLLLIGLAVVVIVSYNYNSPGIRLKMRQHLRPHQFCPASNDSQFAADDLKVWVGHSRSLRSSAHVLVLTKTSSSFRPFLDFLGAVRLRFKTSASDKNLPDLIKLSRGGAGKYFVVVFEDLRDLYRMDRWNRDLLEKYCKQFKVGILGFLPSGADKAVNESLLDSARGTHTPFSYSSHLGIKLVSVTDGGTFPLRTIKSGITVPAVVAAASNENWVGFDIIQADAVQPVLTANFSDMIERPLAVYESGEVDGIKKLVIGGSDAVHFWPVRLLLMDALQHLSSNKIQFPLTRYVLVDIDDIFVGSARLASEDVLALLESQKRLAKFVRGFRYNLGFSGYYFHHGDQYENQGDDLLINYREKFWWFPHMWKHLQPHKFNKVEDLISKMELNKRFAIEKNLPVENQYSVAPHHSGVYPVHQQLYDAWRSVWEIEVTSTEEYPNLRPPKRRRGFTHSGISVLPRQTCGLFTKNTYYDEYPGGPERLEESIHGGEMIQTLMTNPISIFMTHMPNYCCDRLAPYLFESVLSFLTCYTNLNFRTVTPKELASTYFRLFPEDKTAVWGHPCKDKRHMEIWAEDKSCSRLPDFVVIGPQKTGSTALHSFLKMHPSILSNHPSPVTFEEVQFFNGKNYWHGIDWYMQFFPNRTNNNVTSYVFEKSATYFDGEHVPSRTHRLLPDANIVAILIAPEKRAYSWYHHMRAHSDQTAINYSFKEIIMADSNAPRAVQSLQNRCLEPGKYAYYLEKWLMFYRAKQIHVIDGEELKNDPVTVMNRLQHHLEISPFFEYKEHLVFDDRKGFYCQLINGEKKCLGKGKGRRYPPMDPEVNKWLKRFYKHHNEALVKLLDRLGYPPPSWLSDSPPVSNNAST